MKSNTQRYSLTGAIFAALTMLLLSIAEALGIYTTAVDAMQQWHMFYSPDVIGTITGMIEAAVITYVSVYVIVWIYQLLDGKKK